MRRCAPALLVLLAFGAACSHARPSPAATALSATPAMVDSAWNHAQDLFRRHKWRNAGIAFERAQLEMAYDDPRNREALLMIGESELRDGSNLQAAREFRRLSDQYPSDSLAPQALLRAGDAYFQLWRAPDLDPTYGETALSTFQELLSRYPTSDAAKAAQGRIAELNDRFAIRQYKAATFYVKYKAYDSAIIYLRNLLASWPRAAIAPTATAKLIEVYRRLGYGDDVREACDYFRKQWPKDPKLGSSCPVPPLAAGASGEQRSGGL